MFKVQFVPWEVRGGGRTLEGYTGKLRPIGMPDIFYHFSTQNVSENSKESQNGRLNHGELIGGDV